MKKIRLKKKIKRKLIILVMLILISILTIKFYNNYTYKKTYEYKFLSINYTLNEFKIIDKKLNDNELNIILEKEYNKNIPKLINEKYFLFKNLDRYLNYLKENENKSITDIVALVNVNRDRNYYKEMTNVDTSQKESMLVNKYHSLS